MADYKQNFKIQPVNGSGTGCDFTHEVILNPGHSKQVHRADPGDTITFTRVGPNKDGGFTIDFETGGPTDITVPSGTDEYVMTVDVANQGDWYYAISVPDTGVKPLDPVIIINPDVAFDGWIKVLLVVIGILVGLLGGRFFGGSRVNSG